MAARSISEDELIAEGRLRTVCCSKSAGGCDQWIRYDLNDRVTDKTNDRRYIVCPGCGHQRVLAIGIKDS